MKFISEGVLVMFFITNSIVNLDLVFSVPSEMLYSERLVLVFKKKKTIFDCSRFDYALIIFRLPHCNLEWINVKCLRKCSPCHSTSQNGDGNGCKL